MIKTRYPTANGKLTSVNSTRKMTKVVQRFCVSTHMRISLVVLLNAVSSRKTRTTNATGRRHLRITLRRSSLKILKHKLILSFGEQLGLASFVGDDSETAAAGGRQSSLSMFRRFILLTPEFVISPNVTCIDQLKLRETRFFNFSSNKATAHSRRTTSRWFWRAQGLPHSPYRNKHKNFLRFRTKTNGRLNITDFGFRLFQRIWPKSASFCKVFYFWIFR